MRMHARSLSILIIVFTILWSLPSYAFYCGNKLVSEGDSAAEILLKCGEPTRKEVHHEKIIYGKHSDSEHRVTVNVEQWIYNFGPLKWLYSLTLRNGKLVSIDTLGYGYRESDAGSTCDKGRALHVGDTIAEVVQKCGEPLYKDIREDEVRQAIGTDTEHRVTVVIEEWTYNFGSLAWIYLLRFENGKLVDIETRGYGQ